MFPTNDNGIRFNFFKCIRTSPSASKFQLCMSWNIESKHKSKFLFEILIRNLYSKTRIMKQNLCISILFSGKLEDDKVYLLLKQCCLISDFIQTCLFENNECSCRWHVIFSCCHYYENITYVCFHFNYVSKKLNILRRFLSKYTL
jgi:hypothetical protein